MESLGEEPWDVVIHGTGLHQSLLALALSRSKKRILHTDPNDFYGQYEAAFSLREAESFARAAVGPDATTNAHGLRVFRNAAAWQPADAAAAGLAAPRAYALALAPRIVHTKSRLLAQLVASRAYRQVEFLAVGSFFVYEPASSSSSPEEGSAAAARVSRVPSRREDVFSSSSIPARSKRALMKFLKFVLDFEADDQRPAWEARADAPLVDFLADHFKLDPDLRRYIVALTLTLDGNIAVQDGLAAINRHLTSMGLFGQGFCAVYPKWGGLSEVAQVACRAGAVGGGIYMLGTDMKAKPEGADDTLPLELTNDITVQAKALVSSQADFATTQTISRLVAIVKSPLKSLFEVVVEGAPTPAVAVVAFSGDTVPEAEQTSPAPIYALVHSSDTGECPAGQTVVYLTTLATPESKQRLERALELLLHAVEGEEAVPPCLYQLYYEQAGGDGKPTTEKKGNVPVFSFPPPSLGLAFDDSDLDAVKTAWELVMGAEASQEEYMVFEDREGADADDDVFD